MRCRICDIGISKMYFESMDQEVCDDCVLSALEDWHGHDSKDISKYIDVPYRRLHADD